MPVIPHWAHVGGRWLAVAFAAAAFGYAAATDDPIRAITVFGALVACVLVGFALEV